MLYFKADYEIKSFSRKKQDYIEIENGELLTEREIERYQRMGYSIKWFDFTPIITSQKNVKIEYGIRKLIDESKSENYNAYKEN